MKRLFTLLSLKDSNIILEKTAKIVRIIYIVFACLSAFFGLIASLQVISGGVGLLYIILSAAIFFIILIIGLVIEALMLGFSIIVRNNYEELRLKNVLDKDGEETYNKTSPHIEKLHKINELKKNGLLSETEYDKKWQEIISKLYFFTPMHIKHRSFL